jgi:hypothetical protein
LAIGGAAGVKSAGSKGAGRQFSHWIPDRYFRNGNAIMRSNFMRNTFGRSFLNGNFVSRTRHALHDPSARRFMSKIWKASNPSRNKLWQQWDRIPLLWKGTAAGAVGSNINSATNQND